MPDRLPQKEEGVCQRLREAREQVGLSQGEIARRVGCARTTIASFEQLRAPLRCEMALRICRQLVISEEWLATGDFASLKSEYFKKHGPSEDWTGLHPLFMRKCLDLFSEPASRHIKPDTLFSEAYDRWLAPSYAELAREFFYYPARIKFTHGPSDPDLLETYFAVCFRQWRILIENEARAHSKDEWLAQRKFLRRMFEAGHFIFSRFVATESSQPQMEEMKWLRDALAHYNSPIGPIHVDEE